MNLYFYISQAIAFLFAIALAKHDAPAVIHFEHYGVPNNELARFHRYNNWVKFFFCLLAAITAIPEWKDMICTGLVSALWIYLVFDIALNLNRPGKNWDYIGRNDADGRRWVKWFGKGAGEMKAVIIAIMIISVNILKFFL